MPMVNVCQVIGSVTVIRIAPTEVMNFAVVLLHSLTVLMAGAWSGTNSVMATMIVGTTVMKMAV